jgi:phospholipid/cholesterol/gamma-HCH transport system substrate-binding protein
MPIKDKAENLIVTIDSVMKGINHTLTPETQHNIQNSVAALEDLIITEKVKVSSILNSLESVAKNLESDNHSVNNIVKNVSSLSDSLSKADLKKVIDQTKITLAETNEMLAKINAGKGSIGKLINNDSIYNNLNKTIYDLDSLITDLNKHPKKYVHFSVFGSKK